MSRAIAVILLCASSVVYAQVQNWIRQNPLPVSTSIYLWDVCVVDAQTAIVAGQGGEMGKTENGGQTWTGPHPGTPFDLNGSSFLTGQLGWTVGDTGLIVHTSNGGLTWTKQNSGTKNCLNDVQFVDANTGYAVGDTGTLLKTTNGGTTWQALTSPDSGDLHALHFFDATTGWISGKGIIARTMDGGATWTQHGPTTRTFWTLHFTDMDTGWAGGQFSRAYQTVDGGQTWTYNAPLDADIFHLYSMQFINGSEGWAIGSYQVSGMNFDGRVMHTTDGGVTWQRQIQTNEVLYDIGFFNVDIGWVVGRNGLVMHTIDGGQTWDRAIQGPTGYLNDVCFANKDTGWAVGGSSWDSTIILHTINGGSTWVPQQTPVNDVGLESVFFLNDTLGWATGQDFTILKTIDGGATWTGQSGSTTDFQDIYFVDENNGWVVGGNSLQSAVVRMTANGGTNWVPVNVPTTAQLNDIFFLNPIHGWIVGARGTMLKTNNGGIAWEPVQDSALGTLYDVHFLSPDTGWVVSNNGVWKTEDGGSSWQKQLSVSYARASYFVDASTIYLVSAMNSTPFPSIIYRSIDGGNTWYSQFLANGLAWDAGMHFEDVNTGWVVAGGGSILHTANGGGTNWQIVGVRDFPFNPVQTNKINPIQIISSSMTAKGIQFTFNTTNKGPIALSVVDPFGRLLWSQKINGRHNNYYSTVWPIERVVNGLYIVFLKQAESGSASRILLAR